MKNVKISKASWIILAAGVFIIILAGLGMTRSGQIKEYDALSTNLTFTSNRAGNIQTGNLQTEINEYTEQLKDIREQAAEARTKLDQMVISVDVAEKFYQIADYCGVIITNIDTTTISNQKYQAVGFQTISVTAAMSGTTKNILDYVIALNNNFSTGFVRSAQFSFVDSGNGTLGVQAIIYSREGSQ
jgi:hypothetical protein